MVGASRIGEVALGIERMKRISKTFKSKNVRIRQFLDVVTREEAVSGQVAPFTEMGRTQLWVLGSLVTSVLP